MQKQMELLEDIWCMTCHNLKAFKNVVEEAFNNVVTAEVRCACMLQLASCVYTCPGSLVLEDLPSRELRIIDQDPFTCIIIVP